MAHREIALRQTPNWIFNINYFIMVSWLLSIVATMRCRWYTYLYLLMPKCQWKWNQWIILPNADATFFFIPLRWPHHRQLWYLMINQCAFRTFDFSNFYDWRFFLFVIWCSAEYYYRHLMHGKVFRNRTFSIIVRLCGARETNAQTEVGEVRLLKEPLTNHAMKRRGLSWERTSHI